MFPNRHNVYLRDTPSRELFERTARSFSSGCIRVDRALDLASESMADTIGVTFMVVRPASEMRNGRLQGYAIGNTTDFSRHLWGDAADVYVDADGDGRIDDLNRDGGVDIADAQWLASLVDRVMANDETLVPGGLSTYRANAVHGPVVHVGARGYRARW